MAMHRQASAVLVICQIKKLLKELGIKDTDKEVKARVVVWYQSEQSDLLFSQTWQVKLIGGGKPCKALQIEFSSLAARVIWILFKVFALPEW